MATPPRSSPGSALLIVGLALGAALTVLAVLIGLPTGERTADAPPAYTAQPYLTAAPQFTQIPYPPWPTTPTLTPAPSSTARPYISPTPTIQPCPPADPTRPCMPPEATAVITTTATYPVCAIPPAVVTREPCWWVTPTAPATQTPMPRGE